MRKSTEELIEIRLDEAPLRLGAGTTLATLLEQLGRNPMAVATAHNGQFIPRDARHHTVLRQGDQVLLFSAITGG
ncbi:sulfur carrier protein ThiS [Pelomonas sp. SE-A7]|uniref:sulfur carrier protein ThiS n=1 Tax=Pelomonas sp. SE-A7 TaxID=3054953 RepID=UPI00259D0D0F|nr:sulfur carrier protein ThiS [Pelomonas sp. SE-A7]MDM4767881.1 sulfur carrier protein ThiS [Pelomonas sp. SE-A7]